MLSLLTAIFLAGDAWTFEELLLVIDLVFLPKSLADDAVTFGVHFAALNVRGFLGLGVFSIFVASHDSGATASIACLPNTLTDSAVTMQCILLP